MTTFTHPQSGQSVNLHLSLVWSVLFGFFYAFYKGAWGTGLALVLLALLAPALPGPLFLTLPGTWVLVGLICALAVQQELTFRGYLPPDQVRRVQAKTAPPPRRARLAERQVDQYNPRAIACPYCTTALAIPARLALAQCPDCQTEFDPARC